MSAPPLARYVRPDLPEPPPVIIAVNDREVALQRGRVAVAAGFAEHQNELDVVLDDRVGLVGLAEECRPVARGLGGEVADLAPDDRSERVEADLLTLHLHVRMRGLDQVSPESPPGPAHVSDDRAEPPARYE